MSDTDGHENTSSRRGFLSRLGLVTAAVAGGAAAGAGTALAADSGGGLKTERLKVEISCLGHTRAWIKTEESADEADSRETVMLEGWIYPAGTIPPSDGFVPTAEGAIGRWFCRGWTISNGERPLPHLLTTHDYIFGSITEAQQFPPDILSSNGLEGTPDDSQRAVRVVVGGSGKYLGATGQLVQQNYFKNTTVLAGVGVQAPNWTFEFDLRMPT